METTNQSLTLTDAGMLIVALLLGAVGQVALKKALTNYTDIHGDIHGLGMLLQAMMTPGVVFGLACYVLSTVLYLFVMSRIDLSLLYPMVAMNYVFVTVLSRLYLKEEITWLRVVGLTVIIAGVVIISRSGAPVDAAEGPSKALPAEVDTVP